MGMIVLDRLTGMSDRVGNTSFSYANFGAFEGALASEAGPWATRLSYRYIGAEPQFDWHGFVGGEHWGETRR